MSFFSRVANLAKGVIGVQVREWNEPARKEAEDAPRRPDVASPPAPPPPAEAAAPAGKPPERDEHGEVKRTL